MENIYRTWALKTPSNTFIKGIQLNFYLESMENKSTETPTFLLQGHRNVLDGPTIWTMSGSIKEEIKCTYHK